MDPNILPPAPGSLRVFFQDGAVWIHDSQGFLIVARYMETLWKFIEIEANEPGRLRAKLDAERPLLNNYREEQAGDYWIAVIPEVQRYTPGGKRVLDLDDLDLDI